MLENKSLYFKLTFFILSGVILIFIGLFGYYYFISNQTLQQANERNVRNIADKTIYKVESIFKSSSKIPSNLIHILETTTLVEGDLKKLLKHVVQKNEEICGATIAYEPRTYKENEKYFAPSYYKKGDSVNYVNLNHRDYNYFLKNWYQIPKHINTAYWSEPYFDKGAGNILTTSFSIPFYNKINEFQGVMTIDISLEWLQKLFQQMQIYKSGYGFLLSKSGRYISYPKKDYRMNYSIFDVAELNNDSLLRSIGRKMVSGDEDFTEITDPLTENKAWLYYAPVPSSDYSMGIVIPQDEYYASLMKLHRTGFIVALVGLIFLFGVISFVAKKITQPLINLSEATKEIGEGNFNVKLPHRTRDGDEIGRLRHSFEKMQTTLKEYIRDLKTTTKEKEKIQSELRIARDIQMSIVPKIFPPFPENKKIEIFANIDPAKEVAGDFYDYFFIDDGEKVCVSIGDVADKGVPASLFMAVTKTLLKAKYEPGIDAAELLDSVNKELCDGNDNMMFVTVFTCIIDLKTGKLQFANGGHNLPYYFTEAGDINKFPKTKGPALGVMPEADYEYGEMNLSPEEGLLLYTDGVNEAESKDGDFFGYERLEVVLRENCAKSSEDIVCAINEKVKEFYRGIPPHDDVTVNAVRYYGDNHE